MKALILNSGLGKRMGDVSNIHPKCMTDLDNGDTILSRQLRLLDAMGIEEVIITTGKFDEVIKKYCYSLKVSSKITFVYNERYSDTNYIYSIYCARNYLRNDDILLLHGDLVFEGIVLKELIDIKNSAMIISSTNSLPQKDFKAVVHDGKIDKIGIDFFESAYSAQPFYKLLQKDWNLWLDKILEYCENGLCDCYAEDAFNEISSLCGINPLDIKEYLCDEVDTMDDLQKVIPKLRRAITKKVYMCFSTDVLHGGHISIIKRASALGNLVIGVLSDKAVSSYRQFPLIPFEERKILIENIKQVSEVIEQKELSYQDVLSVLKPDFVVHGDDWVSGVQKSVRDEVLEIVASYGGRLIEFPYSADEKYRLIEQSSRRELSMPDIRRGRLRKLLAMKPIVSIIEAHSGITGLIAENTVIYKEGKSYQFDGMWVSSLCDSTAKGKPDIELVDMSSRLRTIDDIMEVTTKPIILDGDTGGLTEHFVYNVRTLERIGVSAIIIEDKIGLKKNSLFGTEVEQQQDSVDNFCDKIKAGKKAQKTKDFMIIARIESLILEQGMEDALKRAYAYVRAGADGIMIHSRKKEPDEIFEFVKLFRGNDKETPIVVVPTSYNQVKEEEFEKIGVNIIIYANQLTRSGIPAMQKVARTILECRRAKEADEMCMSIKDILTLIPEEI